MTGSLGALLKQTRKMRNLTLRDVQKETRISNAYLSQLENNKIAQTTPVELNLAGDIPKRFSAFGIPANQLDTSDVQIILSAARELINEVRQSSTTRALILNTCRFGPHSKGDDPRPQEEISKLWKTRDPLTIQAKRLPTEESAAIEKDIRTEVRQAFQQALDDPF